MLFGFNVNGIPNGSFWVSVASDATTRAKIAADLGGTVASFQETVIWLTASSNGRSAYWD